MGLSRSLGIGESSMQTHQKKFDVISNNIANVNTTGYKSNQANFADQLYQVYNYGKGPDIGSGIGSGTGGIDPTQFGLGVKLSSITQDMSQGVLETTNRPLDIALQGGGFFTYNQNGNELYSRAGAISIDKSGNLVDSGSGAYLQGYNISRNANGIIQRDSTGNNVLNMQQANLNIPSTIMSSAKQTQNVSLSGNLNVSTLPTDPAWSTSINVFDTLGGSRTLSMSFTKAAAANTFNLTGSIDGKPVTFSSASVQFNADGTLNTPLSLTETAANLNTALNSPNAFSNDITIKLADANNLLSGLISNASPTSATINSQDGFQSGTLNDMSVDPNGRIMGSFSNGQSEVLGQVLVSKFTNPAGLIRSGNNFYASSPDSGLATKGTAGQIFPSTKVVGGALENSNVDMTSQFTDMISTQRGYEAAARTITVTDQMLAEVSNLKR